MAMTTKPAKKINLLEMQSNLETAISFAKQGNCGNYVTSQQTDEIENRFVEEIKAGNIENPLKVNDMESRMRLNKYFAYVENLVYIGQITWMQSVDIKKRIVRISQGLPVEKIIPETIDEKINSKFQLSSKYNFMNEMIITFEGGCYFHPKLTDRVIIGPASDYHIRSARGAIFCGINIPRRNTHAYYDVEADKMIVRVPYDLYKRIITIH